MMDRSNFDFEEGLIFERGSPGRSGVDLPVCSISDQEVDAMLGSLRRAQAPQLPECSEPEVTRHYTRLSRWNFSIDTNSYPLGSCTMKYNPRINEWAGRLPGFAELHPYLPEFRLQGALQIMWELQNALAEIAGFEAVSLQPAAGAHGEFAGVMMMHAALKARGETRTKMLVPHSAHGTNPASAAFFGYEIVSLESGPDGLIDLQELKSKISRDCAGIMITNPNTLGLFEKDIAEISRIVHDHGGYVYGDGANLNALMGIVRPGDCGIDVMHFNLHKTFTTPHGGGGPGCGAVGVCKELEPYLPTPIVGKIPHSCHPGLEPGSRNVAPTLDSRFRGNDKPADYQEGFYFDYNRPKSIGRIRSFYGNFGMMLRAWTYIREMGAEGLKKASELAVLNANYVRARLKNNYQLAYETDCLHEVIFQSDHTLDIAKGLIDRGIHPPTVYFPLVVSGALMIEPTETESKEELDELCEAFIQTSEESLESLQQRPRNTHLGRLNEAQAARNPKLVYSKS